MTLLVACEICGKSYVRADITLTQARDGALYREGYVPEFRNDLVVNDTVSLTRTRGPVVETARGVDLADTMLGSTETT